MADETAGDPMSDKQWVRRSLRQLAEALSASCYQIGKTTTGRLLKELNYRLLSNRPELSGAPHPDRDKQFRYLRRVTQLFLAAGYPVISVDTKKAIPQNLLCD